MRKYFLMGALLLGSMAADAKSLVLNLTDGTKVYYLLGGEVNPMMRFVEGNVVVDADTYQLAGIKSFVISETDDPSGIEMVEAIRMQAGKFVVKAADASSVKVYGLNGVEADADVNCVDGYVTIGLDGLQKGAYVIKVGKESLKVMKR